MAALGLLGNLMRRARLEFFRNNPSDPEEVRIADECSKDFADFQPARYAVIQDIQEGLSALFYK
jgi:hypothetical protein